MNFWNNLHTPILALAPMADVTDPAYRRLIAETAPPDVMWTEFVSADGLYYTREKKKMPDGENPLVRDLLFTSGEQPILAQFFGSTPETMEYAARYAREKGFSGVDINMGCPDRSIEKQGAGASHIKDPERAKEIIQAAKRGAGTLPVSVKTRIGYNTIAYKEWLPELLSENIAALTVHLRTRKEMSKVPAHWELVDEIAMLVRELAPETKLLMNGDIADRDEALQKCTLHDIDGVMMGRGIFGNPWLFSAQSEHTREERLRALLTLTHYFGEMKPAKSASLLKKHIKSFITGDVDASALRERLYAAQTLPELAETLEKELL